MRGFPVWTKLDDDFSRNPKIRGLSNPAFRLHVSALNYCCKYLTDGLISFDAARDSMPPTSAAQIRKLCRELADALLWHPVAGGDWWEIHDFGKYQPSRAAWEQKVLGARRAARARWAKSDENPDGNRPDNGPS